MTTAPSPANSESQRSATSLRDVLIGALFSVVLLVPKLLHLRRNPKSWMFFRIFLGLVGASLVIVPVGMGNSFFLSLLGLAMFIGAILLPPAKPNTNTDDKACELGALVVVNGGRFKLGQAPSFAAQLFVGPDRVSVLDSDFQSYLEIPVNEITSTSAEESHGRWYLRIEWANKTATFLYRGVFAEHLARVAESTLQGVMRPALPVIPQRRAASA
jgi:hypothetical protein